MGYPSSFKRALLFAALLAPAAHAQLGWGNAVACLTDTLRPSLEFDGMIATAVMFMLLLITIAYMGGKIFEKPELGVWAKVEAQNLVITGFLIGIIFFGLGVGCSVLGAQSGGSPFKKIDVGLGEIQDKYGTELSKKLVSDAMDSQMKAVSYMYVVATPIYQKGIAYRANQRARAQYRDMLVDIQLPLLVSVNVQRLAMYMADIMVLNALLPAAILFRAFFITRDVGNFLLALSFGLFIVVPMAYLIFLEAYQDLSAANIFTGLPNDNVAGNALLKIGYITPAAILLPNFAMVVLISFVMAGHKALRGIGV